MEWIKNRIAKNNLPITNEEVATAFADYDRLKIHTDLNKYERFYRFILDELIWSVSIIDQGDRVGQLLEGIKIRGVKTTFFEFDTPEEYAEWISVRRYIYSRHPFDTDSKNLRLLNYFEMCMMNFITDITTVEEYVAFKDGKSIHFQKTGFNSSKDKSGSFINYLKGLFNQGYVFKPVTE
jgi:hypothetical protein